MSASASLRLHIANAIPHGNEADTQAIIALWREAGSFCQQLDFLAQDRRDSNARRFAISLDVGPMLASMERASAEAGSFDAWRKAHVDDPGKPIDASLGLTITDAGGNLTEMALYQVATVFLQQLVMAMNITLPGSLQLLGTRFEGPGSHRYEAQQFDSRIFYGALKTAASNAWPILKRPDFTSVWRWLDKCESSQRQTAIAAINKVLFTMLKVAEQRHEYSARTVLLVLYQLEVLLDRRNNTSFHRSRNRARLILGGMPEAADCFRGLYEIRNSLFMGDQPVNRPLLICHDSAQQLREAIGQHNSVVEQGSALVLALLQDLIARDAQGYEFSESVQAR